MEYVNGLTLSDHISYFGRMGKDEAVRIMGLLLDALSAMHKKDYIYADLKPQNIMLTKDGRLKLLDFGMTRKIGEWVAEKDIAPGTPPYMSPEAARGLSLTPQSDIYSAGIILYEMLAGVMLRRSSIISVLLQQAASGDKQAIDAIDRETAPPIAACIKKAMAYDPQGEAPAAGRYATADEMKVDI